MFSKFETLQSKFNRHVSKSQYLEALELINQPRWYIERVRTCGTLFLWKACPTGQRGHSKKMTGSNYCHSRLCYSCQLYRRLQMKKRVMGKILSAVGEDTRNLRFLTLTIQGVPGELLAEKLKYLRHSYKKLRDRKAWKEHVQGHVSVFETTWTTDHWHPHVHAILLGRYWSQEAISEQWAEITGSPVVGITKINNRSKEANINGAVDELTRYITKVSTFNSAELYAEAFMAFWRKRLLISGGEFYGIKEEEENEDAASDLGIDKEEYCRVCGVPLEETIRKYNRERKAFESGMEIRSRLRDLQPV